MQQNRVRINKYRSGDQDKTRAQEEGDDGGDGVEEGDESDDDGGGGGEEGGLRQTALVF